MTEFEKDFVAHITAGVCTGLSILLVFVIAALVGMWVRT